MELLKRSNLTNADKLEIGASLHAKVLEELFKATRWKSDEAVFHGGTSLALARRSPRYSEDLDFMVTAEQLQKLVALMPKILKPIQLAFEVRYPGSTVTLKGPSGKSVSAWMFVWSHPNKHGVVKVKAEFLATKPKLLQAYKSTHVVPLSKGTMGITTPLPVPTLLSAWADKIKAIATRPEMKWRDIFDLDYIVNEMRYGGDITDEDRIEALAATAAIYDKTLEEITDGLESVMASGILTAYAEFERDMANWFDDQTYRDYLQTEMFRDKLDIARREIEGVAVLKSHLDIAAGLK